MSTKGSTTREGGAGGLARRASTSHTATALSTKTVEAIAMVKRSDGRRCAASSARGGSGAPRLTPQVQLRTEGVDRPLPGMLVAVNGKAFILLPSLDGPHFTAEVGGNFLPGFQAILVRTRNGYGDGAQGFGHVDPGHQYNSELRLAREGS